MSVLELCARAWPVSSRAPGTPREHGGMRFPRATTMRSPLVAIGFMTVIWTSFAFACENMVASDGEWVSYHTLTHARALSHCLERDDFGKNLL